jgi:RNA polymerase sigma-70 factor (ECF subfamily)
MAETEEAVQRFLSGEEEAFNQIVRRWERKIYNLAWRMLNNREDAQDVVQETFLSVFKSIRGLRAPESFSTWIYRIALNHCRARRRSRNLDVSLDDPAAGQAGDKKFLIPATAPAGKIPDRMEIIDLIQKSLAGLSEDRRTAIILKEYMGLSLEEAASVMDCPLSTAKSRLYHGLREIQRNLKRLGVRIED